MKALLTIPCALLLVACGSRPAAPPTTPPVAATIPPLTEVARPSIDVAAPLVREASRTIDRVKRENDTLKDTVEKSVDANLKLQDKLDAAIEVGSATKEDLVGIKAMAELERNINKALQLTVENQSSIIVDLQEKTFVLETEIRNLGESIAVANRRLTDNQTQLQVANRRIEELTTAHDLAVQNSLEWKHLADTAEGRIATEVTWKWRFFWWAVIATGLIAAYTALRLHPATRMLIP